MNIPSITNITKVVKAIGLISSATPVIAGFISQIETMLPSASASAKFAAVEAAAKRYFQKIETDVEVLAHILPKIGGVIEGLVELFNESGLFTKAAAATVTKVGDEVAKDAATVGRALAGAIGN